MSRLADADGHDIVEVAVPHKERETGKVSIEHLKLKFYAAGLRQLATFRRCLHG
ncbi:MAG TPA: hypothetical protein VFP85_01065 [Vicinamibacterales bacterium]|nr:hypothetical protein [Vicinamibacterales bacterium]